MTENEMTTFLFKLGDLGVTGVLAIYSGGGDSGAIDDILYTTEKFVGDDDWALDEIDEMDAYSEDAKFLRSLDQNLNDDLNDFLSQYILDEIEDWWNNDGGYGKMSILVPSGKYKINNNVYYTQTEEYFHKGDLLDKTKE